LKEPKEMIESVWPETESHTPASFHVYWNVRDEFSEVGGVILKNKGRNAIKDTSRPKIKSTSMRCTILARNEFSNERQDIEMHHLLRTSTAKHELASEFFLHTTHDLRNSRHRLVHMAQI